MTASDLQIRDAREEEFEQLRNVTLRSYAEYERAMEPDAWAGLSEAVRHALESPPPGVQKIVAVEGGRVVGGVLLYPPRVDAYRGAATASQAPELRLLSVDPSARGKGIGQALVGECIRRSREMGATALGLHTSRSMAPAIRMYENLGFERFPELDFRPDGGELVTAYRLKLE